MSTTIVFIAMKDNAVINVGVDEEVIKMYAAREENSHVESWVLDARSLEEATQDEWLEGRKIAPVPTHGPSLSDVVVFSDSTCRGIGKIVDVDGPGVFKILVNEGDLYDKISRGLVTCSTDIFMYPEDITGIVEASK